MLTKELSLANVVTAPVAQLRLTSACNVCRIQYLIAPVLIPTTTTTAATTTTQTAAATVA